MKQLKGYNMERNINNTIKIPGELYPVHYQGNLAGTDVIYDYRLDKTQEIINEEVNTNLNNINYQINAVSEQLSNIDNKCEVFVFRGHSELEDVIDEVPSDERTFGKIITFIDENTHEWVIYQYCPTALLTIENQWNDLSNWKKLDSKENFLFTSSKDIIKKTINGTQVVLTIDANEQDIYNAKIIHDGIPVVKNFVEKGSKFNQQFIINDASSFEASGKVNGQTLTKYLTVDIAYPIFAGFADLSGVNLSSIYLHDLFNLRVRDSGAINEGGIYNMELLPTNSIIKSTVVNPGYYNFVLAIPRNYSVDISMNGFSVPTQVEDINYSNNSPNFLDVEYKVYVSTNQYENGTYNFNITQQV